MKLRRVRPAIETDTDILTSLYSYLNTCNANPDLVAPAIRETKAAFQGEFKRLTLIGEELVDGEFLSRATASFFTPPADSADLAYYSHQPGQLELSSRPNNFIEFGGLVQLPEAKGFSSLLTPVRALLIRWMREKQIITQDEVLVELLPKSSDRNTFWHEIVYPQFKAYQYTKLCRDLNVNPESLFSTLSQLSFSDRNRIVHDYFPIKIDTANLDPASFSTVSAPAALEALQKIYNLRIIGYFPIDGGQNWIANSLDGLKGETKTTIQTSPDSNFESSGNPKVHQHALVYNPENPYEIYYSPGVWGEHVAIIPSTTASYLGLQNGSKVGYRTIR